MYFHRLASAFLVSGSLIAGTLTAYAYQEQEVRRPKLIKRAKRPNFLERDWNGIYFENLFEDGLVGERPVPSSTPAANPSKVAGPQTVTPAASPTDAGSFTWSQVIGNTVIEDEVKALQQQLTMDVTTPGRFKSDYGKVHQSYSMLSMLFGIIIEYDDDVRWKEMAPLAQPAFARAAANSRVGSLQAYNNAKLQKENLTELVRGGGFGNQQKPVDAVDWASAVKRSPIMVQLETTLKTLKPHLANKTEFTQNNETVLHGASLVAAMGQVLGHPEMDDAEEEDYLVYAEAMKKAAGQVVQGCQTNNYDLAAEGFNLIEQSCSNCHDEWR
ncbi:MAG: hypothetical protein MK108_13695 [Mariniblastus sp.]|nr:hypothetical protein [Mariniblastus sp.]